VQILSPAPKNLAWEAKTKTLFQMFSPLTFLSHDPRDQRVEPSFHVGFINLKGKDEKTD